MKNNKGKKAKALYTLITVATFWFFAVASSEEEDVGDKEPSIEITASQLAKEYADNEVKADSKYNGKVLLVTGTINDIGKGLLDDIYVTMGTGISVDFDDGFGVQCSFPDKHEKEVANLNKGYSIKIKGKCGGVLGYVQLDGCQIVK